MARTPTELDALAERYLDDHAALDPIAATYQGIPGHDERLPDYSPDGLAELSELRRRTLAELESSSPVDGTDVITREALADQLRVAEQIREFGGDEAELNVIASPVQSVRNVFDLMPTASEQDWAVVATRMTEVPAALAGYAASLRSAAARGEVAARRQVTACVKQCHQTAAFFTDLAAQAPESMQDETGRAATAAAAAYQELAHVLADELAPQAREQDPVGEQRYRIYSRSFIGSVIDLAETYAWGQEELDRLTAEMRETANRIKPGATPVEAMQFLDGDASRKLQGTAELQRWMQDTSDVAVAGLAGTHFDIPDEIRTLECRIAPTTTGGIYYTGPSDDLSRPGRMWWSVPEAVTTFNTWRERTTVYHEGVPGHHLQIAQTVVRRNILNRWRRIGSWLSGHGEGWALYAERLMAELGFLDDPADYLGMLDAQGMRAARVVIDIGLHCGFEAPASVGGGEWTYDKAWTLLTRHSAMNEPFLRFELDRYLGWPGQAPSYKVGERLWLALREDARRAAVARGEQFDVKAFHRRALDVGSVGMDALRTAVLAETPLSG